MNANFRGQTRRHTPYTVRRRLCTCRRMPSDSVGHRPAGTLLAQDQERLVCQETWRNLALLLEMQTTHNENLYERQTNIHTFLNVKFLKMSIDGLRIHPISKIHQKILPFVGN